MSDTYEIELHVDDEEIPVEIRELGPLETLRLVTESPDVTGMDGNISISEATGLADFIEMLVEVTSDFPPELLDELTMPEFNYLVASCSLVGFQNEAPASRSEHFSSSSGTFEVDTDNNPFGDLDLNDDGSVDPDDWR